MLYKVNEEKIQKRSIISYSQLKLKDAKRIIALANSEYNKLEIHKKTQISKGKIKRCLEKAKIKTIKENKQKPWKGPRIYTRYSWSKWNQDTTNAKAKRSYNYAINAEPIYEKFIEFCDERYNTRIRINNKYIKVKRSACEWIKLFKKEIPNGDYPKKSWIYKMAKSEYYAFSIKWLPSTKIGNSNKSAHERLKPEKYRDISERPPKELLFKEPGHFEIDSIIGKKTDRQALLSLLELYSGKYYSITYDRTKEGFAKALSILKVENNLVIKTITCDNGGENNMLHTVIDSQNIFNCRPYCSGDKGSIENRHRIVRRLLPKYNSFNDLSESDVEKLNIFVNEYYSKKYNRI